MTLKNTESRSAILSEAVMIVQFEKDTGSFISTGMGHYFDRKGMERLTPYMA